MKKPCVVFVLVVGFCGGGLRRSKVKAAVEGYDDGWGFGGDGVSAVVRSGGGGDPAEEKFGGGCIRSIKGQGGCLLAWQPPTVAAVCENLSGCIRSIKGQGGCLLAWQPPTVAAIARAPTFLTNFSKPRLYKIENSWVISSTTDVYSKGRSKRQVVLVYMLYRRVCFYGIDHQLAYSLSTLSNGAPIIFTNILSASAMPPSKRSGSVVGKRPSAPFVSESNQYDQLQDMNVRRCLPVKSSNNCSSEMLILYQIGAATPNYQDANIAQHSVCMTQNRAYEQQLPGFHLCGQDKQQHVNRHVVTSIIQNTLRPQPWDFISRDNRDADFYNSAFDESLIYFFIKLSLSVKLQIQKCVKGCAYNQKGFYWLSLFEALNSSAVNTKQRVFGYTFFRDGRNSRLSNPSDKFHSDVEKANQEAEPDCGMWQAKKLLDHLEIILANEPSVVKRGQQIIAVNPHSHRRDGCLTGRSFTFALSHMASERIEFAFTLFVSLTFKRVNMCWVGQQKNCGEPNLGYRCSKGPTTIDSKLQVGSSSLNETHDYKVIPSIIRRISDYMIKSDEGSQKRPQANP
ncbi:trehalose phosphatase/synthase 11 [Artemisia annua]|uniref:Trehalose phosphatase/synthase 11 n=1 Tax=Artemisia annua TaxID=35608 RepID=A0A2U1Q6E2_ARTAN|nr:trehalose phosphatase/synthase 11 [Artemisia annua]